MNRQSFVRSAEFELRDDGRTLTGRVVPYGEVAHIVEEIDGELVRYDEQFLKHSLLGMAQGFQARGGKASNGNPFIPLLIDHEDKFGNTIGFATELRSEDDGAYASFRLYDSTDILKIRSVLTESHTGLSIAFRDIRDPKILNGVVSRVQVYVGHVAATPVPAYAGAGITAMRSGDAEPIIERPHLSSVREWLNAQRA